jgi:hypothetical protein
VTDRSLGVEHRGTAVLGLEDARGPLWDCGEYECALCHALYKAAHPEEYDSNGLHVKPLMDYLRRRGPAFNRSERS